MIKPLIFSTLITISISTSSSAQKTHADSIKKIVRMDVKNFKLNNADFKQFRLGDINKKSDFFKPSSAAISNPNLLRDSSYVSAYRNAAYLKTKKRRTTGHHVLVWGTAIVMAPIIVVAGLMGGASK